MTRPVPECGTPAAYLRHWTRGEPIDDACREAQRLKSAAYRKANPDKTRAYDRESKRRQRAKQQEET